MGNYSPFPWGCIMFFKNEKQCISVIETFIEELSPVNRTKMELVISLDNSPKEKIFAITSVFRECLWDIPEAVEMGFFEWMAKNIPERIEAIEYYEALT